MDGARAATVRCDNEADSDDDMNTGGNPEHAYEYMAINHQSPITPTIPQYMYTCTGIIIESQRPTTLDIIFDQHTDDFRVIIKFKSNCSQSSAQLYENFYIPIYFTQNELKQETTRTIRPFERTWKP